MLELNLCRLLLLLIVVVCGCSESRVKRTALVRVRGVVKLDGKPLPKAVVIFEGADGSYSFAQTDRWGRYDLHFDSQTRGVTAGAKTVRISMNRRLRGLNSNDEGGPGDRAGGAFKKQPPETVPERYNLHSDLRADVKADSTWFDFDLKS